MVGFVEGRVAAGASIHTGVGSMLVVFACEGRFGAFLAENAELFWDVSVMGRRTPLVMYRRTFIEDGLPLLVGALVGISHFG